MQKVFCIKGDYSELYSHINNRGYKRILLVKDGVFEKLSLAREISAISEKCGCTLVAFDDFIPNPNYTSVEKGVMLFNKTECEAIIAVGGGSAIDVAKCIKLYANMSGDKTFLFETPVPNDIELIAIPTTAGTGSEATKYSVIYYNGEKQSVTSESIIPDMVFLDETVLYSLPDYQRNSTLCDAFFHAVESYWSVNSTDDSKKIARHVMQTILSSYKAYLSGDRSICSHIQKAAYDAGRAINITQTTAGHAMSYKLTSIFGISHGHAVALCNVGLVRYMTDNPNKCIDRRGVAYLKSVFSELAEIFGAKDALEFPNAVKRFVAEMNFTVPHATDEQLSILAKSVNPVRLKNNPVEIDTNAAREIYREVLN